MSLQTALVSLAGGQASRRGPVQCRARPEGGSVRTQTHRAARWPLSASAASRLSLITGVEWTYLLVFCFPLIISSGMGGKWKQLFIGEIYEVHLAARFPQLPCAAQGLGLRFASSGEEAGVFPSARTLFSFVILGFRGSCLWTADFSRLLFLPLKFERSPRLPLWDCQIIFWCIRVVPISSQALQQKSRLARISWLSRDVLKFLPSKELVWGSADPSRTLGGLSRVMR